MTNANWRILLLVAIVCSLCYGNATHLRRMGDIGLVMDLIDQQYVDQADTNRLYEAAMKGMVDSLDPYSGYIPRESLRPFQAVLEQEFGGLGVSLDGPPRRDQLTVVSTLFDSPAYRAGVKPGDIILNVNEIDVANKEFSEVSKLLRGKEGTTVILTLKREGRSEPLQIKITRALIEVESVLGDRRKEDGRWEYRLQADPKIGYFRVELFGEKTAKELQQALESVKEDCQGIVLDLRDNTGGLLEAATQICDMFLNDGEIVSTRGRNDRVDDIYRAKPGTILSSDVPIAILINGQSASASEVLSACLQDRCRATVVGTRSFGKGSVQNVIPIEGGAAAVRLTTAYYFPPSGRLIHRRKNAKPEDEWGVLPTKGYEVSLDDDATLRLIDRFRDRADPLKNREIGGYPQGETALQRDPSIMDDPQLARAIEALRTTSQPLTAPSEEVRQ